MTVTGPPPDLRFRRRVRLLGSLRELWRARELVFSLAERDLRARYKQAVLGFSWAVVTPLLLMVAFSLVFPRVAKVDTGGVPYPLFSYLGLVPWAFFSTSVSQGGTNIINNAGLLNKVYCPREVFPIASVAVAAVDGLIATLVLGVLFVVFSFVPQPESFCIDLWDDDQDGYVFSTHDATLADRRAPRELARMIASWSAWTVASTSRIRGDRWPPRLAMNADWSSSAACPSKPSEVKTSSQ